MVTFATLHVTLHGGPYLYSGYLATTEVNRPIACTVPLSQRKGTNVPFLWGVSGDRCSNSCLAATAIAGGRVAQDWAVNSATWLGG